MNDSLWLLGEGYGRRGDTLELYYITCPFCLEIGNFKTAFHAAKKKPNGRKKTNFDTLECGHCRGYVMVMWSADESGDLYNYRVLPRPVQLDTYPDYWPEPVGRLWLQAHRSLTGDNWDASAVMARGALQTALRDQNATGANLKQEIDSLAASGVLPPVMKDWSDQVRQLGNDSAHPQPGQAACDPVDAADIVRFLDFLLECLYDLPHRIDTFRSRKSAKT